jgi:hypothetical protein
MRISGLVVQSERTELDLYGALDELANRLVNVRTPEQLFVEIYFQDT